MGNPLMEFMRKPELCVKLPSNGNWYEDGLINYTLGGEVEVFPMLPKDELLMMNPDSLLNGQANISLLKSCVPSIKDPSKLLYPDANVLFLAIQKATYGNTLTMSVKCPKCYDKALTMNSKEEIEEAEKNGEIMTHLQDVDFDISQILQSITFMDKEYVEVLENGLKVYLQPNTLGDKMEYGLMSFNQEKIVKAYKDYSYEESLENEEKRKIMDELTKCYMKINDIGNKIITKCIQKIQLPDETFVTDERYIYEFVTQTKSSIINHLHEKIKKINDIGLPTALTYNCQCCGHEWEEKMFGFNQVDFFGQGS